MTLHETLSLLLPLVAVVISAVALIRSRRLQEQQTRLQKITSELAQKQLQILKVEEKGKSQARIGEESSDEFYLTW